MKHNVTLIKGDGIGPEVVNAAVRIIEATGVEIAWDECIAGAECVKAGISSGVPQETLESIQKNRVALKGPLETPVGYGAKSANVTLRKMFETYGNIRPVFEIPGVKTPFSGRGVDMVIVRENVEDLYAGIEHMQTPGLAQCLKLISRKGCEKISRLAFEFARAEGRKRVTCATKSNIMKLSEGMLKRTFEDVAKEYPDIQADHIIVDNCAHQMVMHPESFDIIVTTNMNGDILSDLGSALVGGLGVAPGANIGDDIAIFEAVHGSAPDIAGKNVVNPTAVILSSLMLLRHLGEFDAANRIHRALFKTMDDGNCLTGDIKKSGAALTTEFTDKIIANLDQDYTNFTPRDYKPIEIKQTSRHPVIVEAKTRTIEGFDIFVESDKTMKELGDSIVEAVKGTKFKLKLMSNRGMVVYPSTSDIEPDIIDQTRVRLIHESDNASDSDIMEVLKIFEGKFIWAHIEKLQKYDGESAYSKAHGE